MLDADIPLRIVERAPSRLALVGELDMAGAPELEARLASCDGDVVLDCSELTFLDASGLGVLMRAREACETRGVTLTVVDPSWWVFRVLSITGLGAVFLTGLEGSAP